jgi:ABC-type lipoprotein export system ATPase subunit
VAPVVDARELFCVYPSPAGGVVALQGLSLTIEDGETCVVLGPSGAGKTTLLRVLAGLERPSAGAASVAGFDLARAPRRRVDEYRAQVVGYADQHYRRALAPGLTAEELVALPLGLGGTHADARRARARELLERVGLLDRADAQAGELSGGEQQRIALCAALVRRPRLLLADEPTGDLDAAASAEVYALLAELVEEHAATAVVVSHDPASTTIADRVVHIRDGRVSEERTGQRDTVVVAPGGWLRVPEEVLHDAGIGDRAVVEARDGAVELRPASRPVDVPVAGERRVAGTRGEVVEARGVSRSYGSQVVLDGLDATFAPGELTAVTGPSGSGKSTLLHLLAGLDLPDAGEVVVGTLSVSALDRGARAALRARKIAVLTQAPELSDFLTARENVELGLALRGVAGAGATERGTEALVAVGLAEHLERRVGVLSAGQRERVALARVFAARPAVVLADEPTSRLDANTTLVIGSLLAELARATGTTVVCATHDPLLIGLADREVRLRDARGPGASARSRRSRRSSRRPHPSGR